MEMSSWRQRTQETGLACFLEEVSYGGSHLTDHDCIGVHGADLGCCSRFKELPILRETRSS